MQAQRTVRLKRTAEGYEYPPLGVTIRRTTMGGRHTAVGHVWWEMTAGDRNALCGSLDDVRTFLGAIEEAASRRDGHARLEFNGYWHSASMTMTHGELERVRDAINAVLVEADHGNQETRS